LRIDKLILKIKIRCRKVTTNRILFIEKSQTKNSSHTELTY
jgi:hypothetical protein